LTDAELDRLRNDGALLRAVISQSVKLQRSGSRWRGLCPFHAEDTPSFTVFDDGHFHCFGCAAHGSVIDYVMQSEGIDFREACDRLAAELGGAPRPKPNGKVRGEDWHPVLPVPGDAPKPAERQLQCDILHEYRDADDRLLFYVKRIQASGGKGKQFIPLTYGVLDGKLGWHDKAPSAPKPPYGLNRLSHAQPDATALLCEGEKAADAAQHMFPEHVGMSWMGGANADELADVTPLASRSVILWGAADAPGRKAVERLAVRIPNARIVNVDGLPRASMQLIWKSAEKMIPVPG
jgi:hypothetical protein